MLKIIMSMLLHKQNEEPLNNKEDYWAANSELLSANIMRSVR